MLADFPTDEVSSWITNFSDNTSLPFASTSALISLQELEAFIAQIKGQQADAVRVYFIRFRTNDTPKIFDAPGGSPPDGCKWRVVSGDLTQGTIAMVPAEKFALDNDLIFTADDLISNKTITVLMPGLKGKGTGMNPPSPTTSPKTVSGN